MSDAITATHADLLGMSEASGALFNEARTHRFRLWRRWNDAEAALNFLMLNPSTADEQILDATVRGCIKRARTMGLGAVEVTNLFAVRSTDPKLLYTHGDPIGEGNDWHILDVARHTTAMGGMVIAAWGAHGKFMERGRAVRRMLEDAGIELHVLHINADGTPKHPLYVADAVIPKPWKWEA